MAVTKNTNDLLTQAATNQPDNTTQQISPADVREMSENLAVSNYNKITDAALVGLKDFSTLVAYESGQGVTVSGDIYISNKVTGPGAFTPADWDLYASLSAADKAKLDFITVTSSADLDQMQTDIAALEGARINKGTFDPSGGVFPGGGTAQDGWTWISIGTGTIDGMEINPDDAVVAVVDNAGTGTAADWHLQDNSDKVLSVNGQTGTVVVTKTDVGLSNVPNVDATDRANHTGTQTASTISDFDTEVSNNTDVTANTAKVSNVTTDLTEGTATTTTVDVNSSDGTNATLQPASTIRAGVMSKAKFDEVEANNSKVTNANHSGDMSGSGILTANPTLISGKSTLGSLSGTEEFLINDGGVLKKVLASNVGGADGNGIYDGNGALPTGVTTVDFDTNSATVLEFSGGKIKTVTDDDALLSSLILYRKRPAGWGTSIDFTLNNSLNVETEYARVIGWNNGDNDGWLSLDTRVGGAMKPFFIAKNGLHGFYSGGTASNTNPNAALEVRSNATGGGNLMTMYTNVGGTDLQHWFQDNGDIRFAYTSGNVGIGLTTSPSAKLHVGGTTLLGGNTQIDGSLKVNSGALDNYINGSGGLGINYTDAQGNALFVRGSASKPPLRVDATTPFVFGIQANDVAFFQKDLIVGFTSNLGGRLSVLGAAGSNVATFVTAGTAEIPMTIDSDGLTGLADSPGNIRNANSVLTITSSNTTTDRAHLFFNPITAAKASGITAADGQMIYVNSTDATFTSVGFWGRENGVWIKL